jgi:hypothetical protein
VDIAEVIYDKYVDRQLVFVDVRNYLRKKRKKFVEDEEGVRGRLGAAARIRRDGDNLGEGFPDGFGDLAAAKLQAPAG